MVVPAVHHQDGDPYTGYEVDLVRLGQRRLKLQAARKQDGHLEAVFDREDDWRDGAPPAQAQVCEMPAVDVLPRFEVVDGPPEVFRPRDHVVAPESGRRGGI